MFVRKSLYACLTWFFLASFTVSPKLLTSSEASCGLDVVS